VPTGERGSVSGTSPALFRRVTKQALGLALMLGLVLLVIGCGERGMPTKADRSSSHQSGPADRKVEPTSAARPASDPPGRGPQTIPGMNADAVAAIFLKPGLECFEPVDRDVLYACSSEDNHDLPLLYDGKITGSDTDLVSTVWARVPESAPETSAWLRNPSSACLAPSWSTGEPTRMRRTSSSAATWTAREPTPPSVRPSGR